MSVTSAPVATTPQVCLGLFIVWQVLFLIVANGLGLLEKARSMLKEDRAAVDRIESPWLKQRAQEWVDQEGHLSDAEKLLDDVTNRWAQLTNQAQSWSLFAPGITSEIPFVAVELHWPEGTSPRSVMLLSENEPGNIHSYFRFGQFRMRRYESSIDLNLSSHGREADAVALWRRTRIEDRVRLRGDEMRVYARWRMRRYLQEHPEVPVPQAVVLWMRMYHIPAPDRQPVPWTWTGPEAVPVARWWLGRGPFAETTPVERFDPILDHFERLP